MYYPFIFRASFGSGYGLPVGSTFAASGPSTALYHSEFQIRGNLRDTALPPLPFSIRTHYEGALRYS